MNDTFSVEVTQAEAAAIRATLCPGVCYVRDPDEPDVLRRVRLDAVVRRAVIDKLDAAEKAMIAASILAA